MEMRQHGSRNDGGEVSETSKIHRNDLFGNIVEGGVLDSSREAEVRFPKIAPEVRTSRDGNLALGEVWGGYGWHESVRLG